jgi:hypothetical protein
MSSEETPQRPKYTVPVSVTGDWLKIGGSIIRLSNIHIISPKYPTDDMFDIEITTVIGKTYTTMKIGKFPRETYSATGSIDMIYDLITKTQ